MLRIHCRIYDTDQEGAAIREDSSCKTRNPVYKWSPIAHPHLAATTQNPGGRHHWDSKSGGVTAARQIMDYASVFSDLCDEASAVKWSTVPVRMQLNINSAS
jgi:hypothetical protein